MTKIESLLPYVMPYAPGLSEPMAIMHIREAARRFCERTRCWRNIEQFKLHECNQDRIILAIPQQGELFELEWAKFGEQPLEAIAPTADMWRRDIESGKPRYITQVMPDVLRLMPQVKHGCSNDELAISYFIKPSLRTNELPAFLFNQFGSHLANGALATLLLLPNEPFSNPTLAMVFEQKFNEALDRNFNFNLRGQQRAPSRTKSRYF